MPEVRARGFFIGRTVGFGTVEGCGKNKNLKDLQDAMRELNSEDLSKFAAKNGFIVNKKDEEYELHSKIEQKVLVFKTIKETFQKISNEINALKK